MCPYDVAHRVFSSDVLSLMPATRVDFPVQFAYDGETGMTKGYAAIFDANLEHRIGKVDNKSEIPLLCLTIFLD